MIMTAPAYGTVEHYVQQLRWLAECDDSREGWAFVEGLALDLIDSAADARLSSDARHLAEVRNILAAVAELKAERLARIGRTT